MTRETYVSNPSMPSPSYVHTNRELKMSAATPNSIPQSLPSPSGGKQWECSRCTMVNDSHQLNCTVCCRGSNPYHGNKTDLTQQLLKAQEKRLKGIQVKRSIGNKVISWFSGWTCPVCTRSLSRIEVARLDSCPSCNCPIDSIKPSGSVFPQAKAAQSPPLKDDLETETSVGNAAQEHRESEQMIVVRDIQEQFGTTISPIDPCVYTRDSQSLVHTPLPSIDYGTCTMSDTTSQIAPSPPINQDEPDSVQQQPYNTPITSSPSQHRVDPIKKKSFPTDDRANSQYSVVHHNPQLVCTDSVSERRPSRPTQLLTEANNITKAQRTKLKSFSEDDLITPTPQKQYTQLFEVTGQEDVHKESQSSSQEISQSKLGKQVPNESFPEATTMYRQSHEMLHNLTRHDQYENYDNSSKSNPSSRNRGQPHNHNDLYLMRPTTDGAQELTSEQKPSSAVCNRKKLEQDDWQEVTLHISQAKEVLKDGFASSKTNEELLKANANQRAKLKHYQDILQKKQKDCDEKADVISRLESTVTYFQRRVEHLEASNKQQQREIEVLSREKNQLEACYEQQQGEIQQLSGEKNVLEAKLAESQDELSQYCFDKLPNLGRCQGMGAYGSVYHVQVNGMQCIAKRIQDILLGQGKEEQVSLEQKQAAYHRFRQECILLSRIRHPNVVQFLGVHHGPEREYGRELTLIMECLSMDLEECLLKRYKKMPMPLKISILLDISRGLLHIHARKVIHRDLTAPNVLLTESFCAKIADLGVSKIIDVDPHAASQQSMIPGALGYMPPEALVDKPCYSFSLDIFSFGVLMLFVLLQEFPQFSDNTITVTSVRRKEVQIAKRVKWISRLSTQDPKRELICRCLQDIPEKRPGTHELNSILERMAQENHFRFSDIIDSQKLEKR